MRHSRRTTLTVDDVDGALKLRNVEVSISDSDALLCNFMFLFTFVFTVINIKDVFGLG